MAVKKISTQNEDLNRVQDSFIPALNALLGHPILDGRLTDRITIAAGTFGTQVPHKLGRRPIGWWVVSLETNTPISEVVGGSPDDTKFINIQCGTAAACSFRLWVF